MNASSHFVSYLHDSYRQSEQSSQNAYSGLTPSYVNNGGGQRLDVTDEGNVFMMFSPAEHTDSMKRRKERKRRERHERKTNELKSKSSKKADMQTIEEKKTQDQSDVSSVAPTVVTPSKSKNLMDSSGRTVVQSNNNPSPRSVSVLPVENSTKTAEAKLEQVPLHSQTLEKQDEYNYSATPVTPTRSVTGSHRGISSRVIIHESRGQVQNGNATSAWTSRDYDNDSESSNGYNIKQQCNVMRSYCEEMPKDDDDMFYSNWCSFCVLDTKGAKIKR